MWLLGQSGPAARLYITLDKSAYVAGEIVRGRVAVAVFRDIIADGLSVQICGHEHISWTVEVTERHHDQNGSHTRTHTRTRTRSNAFLDDRIPLFIFPRSLAKGNYEFTFAYQSHASLPGAFTFVHTPSIRGKWKKKDISNVRASISYSVHATLDEGYWFSCWNAHTRSNLVIHELPKACVMYRGVDISGSHDATSQSVRLFSLLNQGKCDVAAWLAKPVYTSGETAVLQYRIKNASHTDIRVLKVVLFQDMVLWRKSRVSDSISTRVASAKCAGVAAHSEVDSFLTLALVRATDGCDLAPTTNGSLIRCSYRLQLQCDISWSPDVFLNLPIVIASSVATSTATAPLATPVPLAVGVPVDVSVPAPEKCTASAPLEEAIPIDDTTSRPTASREGSRFKQASEILSD